MEQIDSELEVLGVVVSCLAVPWPTPPSIFTYSVIQYSDRISLELDLSF